MRPRPVFITGFMGAGKSRIGRQLARELGRVFLDTDEMVEARAGKSIAEIFAEDGEARFRALESECVAAAAARRCVVVALGGGAIVNEDNVARVQAAGVLVWLDADVDTILERVSRRSDRPLLAGLGYEQQRERIQTLLASRLPFYRRAHVRVRSLPDRSPQETAATVLKALEEWRAHHSCGTG